MLFTLEHEHVTEVFAQCGEVRVSAEQLAGRAAQEARRYLQSCARAGDQLADQLLLPLVLADGGELWTVRPTDHLTTNAQVIARFLGDRIVLQELAPDDWRCGGGAR